MHPDTGPILSDIFHVRANLRSPASALGPFTVRLGPLPDPYRTCFIPATDPQEGIINRLHNTIRTDSNHMLGASQYRDHLSL